MLDWKEIKGIKKGINYKGHKEYRVDLPELNEEVLFCRPSYRDETKNIYFSGYIYEDNYGLQLVNSIVGGIEPVANGIKWTRFNKPETKNNVKYGIAYLNEYGNGFLKDIPNIIEVEEDMIEQTLNDLNEKGYIRITIFSYISPCTFDYNWDYIESHKKSEKPTDKNCLTCGVGNRESTYCNGCVDFSNWFVQ